MSIPFNLAGHTGRAGSDLLYWVDASDSSSYSVDGSNNVTQLINKGTAGGVFTINGSPKYLNNGFESHVQGDNFKRSLNSNLIGLNSFSVAVAYRFDTRTSSYHWFADFVGNGADRLAFNSFLNQTNTFTKANSTDYNNLTSGDSFGLNVCLISYDINTQTLISVNADGNVITSNSVVLNAYALTDYIQLLQYSLAPTIYAGANNPLHEFRLYDFAMTQQQMTNLQTQLNNKWI